MENDLEPVVDVTVDNMQAVVETSNDRLVVMSFYSDQIPDSTEVNQSLLAVSQRYQEYMVIAHVNCDTQPQMAQYFQIQNIPTIMLLQDGRMIDGFSGKKTPEELETFLEKYLPEIWQLKWQQAQELHAQNDLEKALALLKEAFQLQQDPQLAYELMLALIEQKSLDEVQAILDQMGDLLEDTVQQEIKTKLLEVQKSLETPEMQKCKQAFEKTPTDPQVVLDYALLLHASGRQEQAFKMLIAVLSKNLNALEGELKASFMTLLATHEQDDILVKTYRRQFYGLLH